MLTFKQLSLFPNPPPMEIKQITLKEFDERFYQVGNDKFYPSVTHILHCCYPTPYQFVEWYGRMGVEQANYLKDKAADEGSLVHDSIDRLLKGEKVSTDEMELKVKRCIQAFLDWYKETKPEIISHEYTVLNEKLGYAGTVDLKCKIGDKLYIVDYKTSKSIYDSHKCQLMAYAKADEGTPAILHLGNTTRKRYSFIESIDDNHWQQFLTALNMFKLQYPNARPTDEAYPEFFTLKP